MRSRPFISEIDTSEFPASLLAAHGKAPLAQHAASLEFAANNYLSDLGIDRAVRFIVALYGRREVKAAIGRLGKPRLIEELTRHEIVWLLVETRRSACRQTIRAACHSLARKGGIQGVNPGNDLVTRSQIEKAFYDADTELKRRRETENWVWVVQNVLSAWRKSGKPYDSYEASLLKKPGWRIRAKKGIRSTPPRAPTKQPPP